MAQESKRLSPSRLMRPFHLLALSGIALILQSCVSSPSRQFAEAAKQYEFKRGLIATKQFDLTVFTNTAFDKQSSNELHVYIGGDGQPFFRRQYINSDPTSRDSLTLKLMSLDSARSVYLGRPCYHAGGTRNCQDSKWWTSHRYNSQVVASLEQALNKLVTDNTRLTIIGFSGGATLATLLTMQRQNVNHVVGINPNLNTDAWTKLHGYSPLTGSLNPTELNAKLPNETKMIFLVGEQDENAPAALWSKQLASKNNIEIRRYQNYGHRCCWTDIWTKLLLSLPDPTDN